MEIQAPSFCPRCGSPMQPDSGDDAWLARAGHAFECVKCDTIWVVRWTLQETHRTRVPQR